MPRHSPCISLHISTMEVSLANAALVAVPESVLAFCLLPNFIADGTLASFFLACLALNFGLYGIYKLFLYPFFLSPLRHLPTAKGFKPLVGYGIIMFQHPPGKLHLNIMKATPNEGIIRTFGFFHTGRVIVTNSATLADVLRAFLRKFLGDGLLMTEVDEHKRHRKQIMPAFHFRHIEEMYSVFWAKSIEFCNAVKSSLADNASKILEIGHYLTQVTLDIIGLAGLGRNVASLRSNENELFKNYEEIMTPTLRKSLAIPIMAGNLKRICTDFVVDRKSKMKQESEESRDILSIMIRSNNFSDGELASHLLSKNPAIQDRSQTEIQQRIPDPQILSDPTCDVAGLLDSVPYLNGVCNKLWVDDAEELVPTCWIDKTTGWATMSGGADSDCSILKFLHGP
ncbi:cytochrome P450 [Didymella exigua CBS 183.55]|uniref:Cytochrome P450 n=1 Tax=Didymella exigua CBS 183.55 TaxID=1150837 RepID=A0A6A5RBR4_9PLEO|nr:cytochrome P450 [Didymella exigua CBS 183.55]KAF1924638.1 cytochrome P450 [Didymella exigua CBS 183.55]